MKKRLLSAALALAMVLTLLPVSVFAAGYDNPESSDIAGDGTETVKFVGYRDTTHPAVGWYVTHTYPAVPADPANNVAAKPAKSVDLFLEAAGTATGVSVGGRYYKDAAGGYITKDGNGVVTNTTIYNYAADNTTKTGLKGAVIVIGGDQSIDVVNAGSLNLEVYGGKATITQANTGNSTTKLASITVTNPQYAAQGKGEINVDAVAGTLTSLTLNHVTLDGRSITLNSEAANGAGVVHTVSLTDVTSTASISLDGVGTNSPVTEAGQRITLNKSSVGGINVTGNGSTVSLTEMPIGGAAAVSMTGTGGSFSFTGGGAIGALTITGNTVGGVGGIDLTTAPPSVSIGTDCTVASINASGVSTEKAAGRNTVTINGIVSGVVNFRNAAVTVNGGGGNTGAIAMESGTVTVSGNRATVGGVTLDHDATFTLNGTNCTVGPLAVGTGTYANKATVTFTVPNTASNTLTSITNYDKDTINGGTWKNAVDAKNLASTLVYQYKSTDNPALYTYYTADQLGEAVLKQGRDGGELTLGTSGTVPVTFKNGTITWGVLKLNKGDTIPLLPTQMNTVATPKWSDKNSSNLSGFYNVPLDATAVTLDASGGGAVTGDVTKLTGVKLNAQTPTDSDITASLVGNVITLSGAVGTTDRVFNLTLETDAVEEELGSTGAPKDPKVEKPITIAVSVSYNAKDKTLTFVNPGTPGFAVPDGAGVVVTNDFKALKLPNGTQYTLNGSGLVVRNYDIKVKGIDTTGYPTTVYSVNDIEVVVNAPGYTTNDTTRQTIINLVNNTGSSWTWTDSPAVRRAVNAALASITDTQLQSWFQAARQRAWNENGIRGQALTTTTPTAYTGGTACLVPYLQVTVTDYKPTTSGTGGVNNGTMTATLTLMWRVEIHPAADSTDPKVNDAPNVAKNGVFIAKTGTALNVSGDLRKVNDTTGALENGVAITLKSGVPGATWAHQDGTYDYAIGDSDKKFTVTHAARNGNLGTFVFDTAAPLVTLYKSDTTTKVSSFSTLQAAVDEAADGQYILVDSNYAGSTTINMTGKARTIKIQANGKNVVVANASGGLVENNNTGSLYTIKLNRDNMVASTGNITVNSATGGSASVNANPANVGQTVTITLSASSGYTPSGVSVRDSANNAVSVNGSGRTYTFVMPAGSVTVTPSFSAVAAAKATVTVYNPSVGIGSASTTAGRSEVAPGTVVTVTTTPATGQRTMGLSVSGATAYRTGVNQFQFTVPSGYSNVSVTPLFDRDNGTIFADVWTTGATEYCSNAVQWAVSNGVTTGTDTYTFSPTASCTRAQMVTFLWRAAGRPSVAGVSNPFVDVSPTLTPGDYYSAILWAVSKGITQGVDRTHFGPNQTVTRGQAVTFLYRFENSPAASTNSGFYDVSSSQYYAKAVSWANTKGITNGTSVGYFSPESPCQRGQIVTFLYRDRTGRLV